MAAISDGIDFAPKGKANPVVQKGAATEFFFLPISTRRLIIIIGGKAGYPCFGELILDCLNRTENAMTQVHAFKAAELCVKARLQAVNLTGRHYD